MIFNIGHNGRNSSRGFTLLELLVAIALFAVVVSLVYPAYTGTFRNIDSAESQAEIYQMARTALDRILDDLESANIPDDSESSAFLGEDDFYGDRAKDTLNFTSRAHVSFGSSRNHSGNAKIGYYVQKKDEEVDEQELFTLYRSDVLEAREWPEKETGGLLLCENLRSIDITYYDDEGNRHEYWNSQDERFKNRLPSMVSVVIEFYNKANPEEPLRFATAAAIPLTGLEP